ncbi:Virulence factor mviN [Minicystis rosea]|nr:Virulence factor mviN [Minicystis rosea]
MALWRAGTGEPGGHASEMRAYLRFIVPVALGQAALSALVQMDSLLLSRYLGLAAVASGRHADAAGALVGVYRGVTLFAMLPYQLMSSVSLVLFPMLARASAGGDGEAVRAYTRAGMRHALILTGLMCSVLAGLAPQVLAFGFADPLFAERGGGALRILAVGMGGFAILAVTTAALASLGRERHAAALTFSAVGLVAIGVSLVVPHAAFGADMLVRAALATSAALVATAAVGVAILARVAGSAVSAATLGRVLAAGAIAIAVCGWLPRAGRMAALFEAPLVAAVYVGVLVASRELGAADLARLNRVVGRRGP